MSVNNKKAKVQFWWKRTLLNALVIILLYPIGLIIGGIISGAMKFFLVTS
jgi:hypothetical protein